MLIPVYTVYTFSISILHMFLIDKFLLNWSKTKRGGHLLHKAEGDSKNKPKKGMMQVQMCEQKVIIHFLRR